MDEGQKAVRQLFAMIKGYIDKPKKQLVTGPRSWSDEYPWVKKIGARDPITPEMQENWKLLPK